MKFGCLLPCKACGQTAATRRQLAYSQVFSDHHFPREQLAEWSRLAVEGISRLPRLVPDEEARCIADYGRLWGNRPDAAEDAAQDVLPTPPD